TVLVVHSLASFFLRPPPPPPRPTLFPYTTLFRSPPRGVSDDSSTPTLSESRETDSAWGGSVVSAGGGRPGSLSGSGFCEWLMSFASARVVGVQAHQTPASRHRQPVDRMHRPVRHARPAPAAARRLAAPDGRRSPTAGADVRLLAH